MRKKTNISNTPFSAYLEDLGHEIVRIDDARFRRHLLQEGEILTILERRVKAVPEEDEALEGLA